MQLFRFSVSTLSLMVLVSVVVASCDRTANDTSTGQTAVTRAENEVEQDFAELKTWMADKASQIDSTKDERWPAIKEEFRARSAKLDARADSLSAKSKAEYKDLKFKFNNWEAVNHQRSELPLNAQTLQQFQTDLLGSASILDSPWEPTQVQGLYARFVQNLRARRSSLTANDWDYVDKVYQQMGQKKDAVEARISTKDKLKIKALQADYLALETGKDARDLIEAVK